MRVQSFVRLAGAMTLALALAGGAFAQDAAMQEKLAAVKQAAAQNQAALQQYQWTETTQVAMKGEVKSTTRKNCYYGNDGKVVKVPMASPEPQQKEEKRGGRHPRVKEKIIENKKEEISDYMKKAIGLVHQYVPPAPDKMQSAFQSGKVTVDPSAAPGMTSLVFKDYNLQGDSMTFSISQADKKMTKLSVNSYIDDPKDAVTLNVTFATLADGTSYPGQTVLDVTAKNMTVTVSNSDYKKAGN